MKGKKILIGTTLIVGFLSLFGYLVKKAGAATNITITNVNAAGVGQVYQAELLYMEV